MIFGASEYAKDGLIPIVEITGQEYPWFDRMRGIVDDIFKHARIETPYGKIPSTNIEVNGELLQLLPRLFTMTHEKKYLDWSHRLADYYLLPGKFIPTRLSDHGCEIIGGLGLLLGVQSTHNPAKARAILREAGFIDRDGDGVVEDPQGNPVEFTLVTNAGNTQREHIAQMIRKDLEEIGFKVHFTFLEFNVLVDKLDVTYDWDACILGLTGGIEPHFGRNVWHSSGHLHMWYPRQKRPATPWEARIDEIFDTAVQELDRQKRKALYDEWQRIVAEQLPFIYTVVPTRLVAVRNKFGNLYPTSYGGVLWNLEELFVKEN